MGVPPDESQPYGRLKDLIEKGLDVFGGAGSSLASAAVGFVLSGPEGAAIGGAAGSLAGLALRNVGHELVSRLMAPREQVRLGTVFTLAAAEIVVRCGNGEKTREDGFFSISDDGRSPAEEVWENALLKSQREPEEKNSPTWRILWPISLSMTRSALRWRTKS